MKIDHFKDRLWRLRNLYSIKDAETGRVIPFVPRPEQEAVFQALAGASGSSSFSRPAVLG